MGYYSNINYLLNNALNNQTNIRYKKHKSVFDSLVMSLDDKYLIIDNEIKNLSSIYSNLAITNNPHDILFDVTTDNYNKKICCLHDHLPKNFKKEDKQIIEIKLLESNVDIMFFDESILQTWDFKKLNTHLVSYGIPNIDSDKISTIEKNKDIAVYNTKNHPTISRLTEDLKKDYYVEEIKHIPSNIDELITYLSQFNLIINLEHTVNNLINPACHTLTITNRELPNGLKLESISTIVEYDKIFQAIPLFIKKAKTHIIDYSKDILEINQYFDWHIFDQQFYHMTKN